VTNSAALKHCNLSERGVTSVAPQCRHGSHALSDSAPCLAISDAFLLAGVSGRDAYFAIEARQDRLDEGIFHDLHECIPSADVCLL
jgi:hypothetical protein